MVSILFTTLVHVPVYRINLLQEPLGIFGGAMGGSEAGKEAHSIDPAETSMDSKITDDVVELDIGMQGSTYVSCSTNPAFFFK